MSLTALILLIVAAALHTGWNLLVKRAGEKQIFAWWAMVVGTACFAPLLAFSAPLPAAIWPYVLASALVETIYYLALLRAYTIGDFSLIYPLARGAAPAFLALWAALFLGERPRAGGIAGLALLLVGLLLVGGAARRAALRQNPVALALSAGGAAAQPRWSLVAFAGSATAAALTVACCISIYSVIDGAAVRIAPPIAYTVAVIGASALMMAPAVLARYGRQAVVAEWRANWDQRGIRRAGGLALAGRRFWRLARDRRAADLRRHSSDRDPGMSGARQGATAPPAPPARGVAPGNPNLM